MEKRFKTEEDARAYQKKLRKKANSEIIPVPSGKPHGHLRFTNLDNHYSFDAPKPIQVVADEIELADVDVGSGFHWETTKHRIYGGRLEYLVDDGGLITVVNELSLEDYLKGVVPSEMPPAFPYEALKAQAVAARVEAVSKIGLRHPYEPFDLCDDVHCQVYSGRSRQAEKTDMAVESTRGIFMIYKDHLAEAFYAGVCGGHTENNENVWLTDPQPYLRGILDKAGNKSLRTSLKDEKNLRKWIDSSPDVYCNARKGKVPKSVGYSKKYFRWQVEYSRSELERIIHDKTGEDFGHLVDLVPQKRGVSGRMIELEVVGTKDRFVISRELAIRQALAPRTLFSSCFYVKKKGGTRGLPKKFVLKGAGWGHGVGMCQVGAAVMAARGKKFDQILTHYYRGVFLKKLYN
ncbi:MAG: SpoIID/LytB domain-containing protein [Calditrichaeota bacterium]|nr:MAG: SpoIID/LytB domain-containing protein [Calditrichota bacterium]